jgi:DNA-directed RNA polymerase subunit omega
MIHPSYVELMRVVNNNVEIGEEPVVNSRYSIVAATAKRARQITAERAEATKRRNEGKEHPTPQDKLEEKPLSVAVRELYNGDLQILSEETAEEYDALEASYKEAQAAARAAVERENLEAEAARKPQVEEEDEADAEDEAEVEDDAEAEEEQDEEE